MKKLFFIMALLIAAQTTNLTAQNTDIETVLFTAELVDVLNLSVTSGETQEAVFDTPDEYNLGIDAVGTTTITVESTADWDLIIDAADFSGGSFTIPITNLGVWCEATGTHLIGTEVGCLFTEGSPMGLTSGVQTLINNLAGSGGDATDNAFNLNWKMGTMEGTMNGASMFEQLSNGTIGGLGTYTTTVNLTLTALP